MTLRARLEELIRFAEKAGYDWREPVREPIGNEQSAPVFALMSGDPDFYCLTEDGKFVVRINERGQFSERKIVSDRIEDIEKYLSFALGSDVRGRAGLPRLFLTSDPVVIGGSFGGFRIGGEPGNLSVTWSQDGVERSVSGLSRYDAGKFVKYSPFSAKQIRESFLDDSRRPLVAGSEPGTGEGPRT